MIILIEEDPTLITASSLKEKTVYGRKTHIPNLKIYYLKEDNVTYKIGLEGSRCVIIKVYGCDDYKVGQQERERIISTYFNEIIMEELL